MHGNEYFLHQCVGSGHIEAVESLLKTKVLDVNQKDQDGNTALHLVTKRTVDPISKSGKSMTRCLLDAGADFNVQNEEGNTPLHNAAWSGNLLATQLLLQKEADPFLKNNNHQTPIDLAEGAVERLLRVRTTEFPLHDSVRTGNEDDVEALLELKDEIDINKQDEGGNTPLHYAAEQDDPAMVNILIRDEKIKLSLEDNNSMTPLDRAAVRGSAQTVKAILSSGVNPNRINTSGRASIHYASSRGEQYIIRVLMDAGADVHVITQQNEKTSKETNVDVQCENRSTANTPSPSPENNPSPQLIPSPSPRNSPSIQLTPERSDLRYLEQNITPVQPNEYGSTPRRSASSPSPQSRLSRSPSPRPENNSLLQPTSSSSRAQLLPRTNMDISNAEQLPKSRGRE